MNTQQIATRNTHPGRKCVATIAHNDPEINGRVALYVRRLDADGKGRRYAIIGRYAGEEHDAGQYRWHSRKEAVEAIEHLWRASCWDLQWEG